MSDEQSHDLIDGLPETKPVEKSEVRKQVEEFLGKRYDVYLADGRIVSGVLIATDKDANMILMLAEERWSQNPEKGSRKLGQAMISKKHVLSMYVSPEPMRYIPVVRTTQPSPPKPSTPPKEEEKPEEPEVPSPVAPKPAAKNTPKQKSKSKKKSKK